jgi:hypothetical protein
VNEAFAKRYFPNGDALGHMVRVPELKNHPPGVIAVAGSNDWTPIIGIVGDARNNGLDDPVKPEIYFPYSLYMIDWVQIFVRSQKDPMTLETAVRRQVAGVNPGQQISSPVVSMNERIQQQPEWARAHLVAVLSGIFSSLALVLAGVGLYSIVSYGVAGIWSERADWRRASARTKLWRRLEGAAFYDSTKPGRFHRHLPGRHHS